MHAVLSSIGTDGDVFPYIGLADVLRRRGHRVTLVAADRYQKTATDLDIEFVPMFTEPEMLEVLSNPRMWHPLMGPQLMAKWGAKFLPRQYELLDETCEDNSVLIASPGLLSARTLREKRKISLVNLVLQPWMVRSNSAPPVMPAQLTLPAGLPAPVGTLYWRMFNLTGAVLIGGNLQRLRKPLDLPRVKQVFDWWFSPDLVLGMFPDWYGPPQSDWRQKIELCGFPMFDGQANRELPPETKAFCEAGPPPVAFTFGTGMMHAQRLFAMAVDACRAAGLRAILLTAHGLQLSQPLPDSVHHCTYAPFALLFPLCSAVVHHGGIGTTAKALGAGVPQLILPFAYDQLDNGTRVKKLGVGNYIKPRHATVHRLADLVRLIQDADIIKRCRAIGKRLAESDALIAAAEKTEMFWESRSTRP